MTTPDLPRTLQFLLLLLFPLVDFKDCPLLELGLGVQKFHQLIAWIPPPLPFFVSSNRVDMTVGTFFESVYFVARTSFVHRKHSGRALG